MTEPSIIITAGGVGKRMGTELPKQFLLLGELPILMHTITRFNQFSPNAQLILTLPAEWIEEWKGMCVKHHFRVEHLIVAGGKERFHSVKNAIAQCEKEVVFIHDGVRPLVSKNTFESGLKALKTHVAAIPVLPIFESLRKMDGEMNHAVNRNEFTVVQTPQCFRKKELVAAYEQEFSADFMDDASVLEAAGVKIHLFEGNVENIKITQQSDLALAEFYMSKV